MKAIAYKLTSAIDDELPASLWSFVYFFSLLAGYYVLRPIRDEMAIQIGVKNLPALFTYVFFTMLALVPVFGWITAKVPRRKLLPWLYAFFVANLIGFYVVMQAGEQSSIVAHVFYIWASVFNLFAVSVFWSFMADCFRTDQAKRLYRCRWHDWRFSWAIAYNPAGNSVRR
jgi:ATP:ADP antiporter, AAA family